MPLKAYKAPYKALTKNIDPELWWSKNTLCFWPAAGRGAAIRLESQQASANYRSATTADTSHTACGPDHLRYTHNWLLVVSEGKLSSHPTRSHMSQTRRADKAGRPHRETPLCQQERKHLSTSDAAFDSMWWDFQSKIILGELHFCFVCYNLKMRHKNLSRMPWNWSRRSHKEEKKKRLAVEPVSLKLSIKASLSCME